jgi:hypothetical protein
MFENVASLEAYADSAFPGLVIDEIVRVILGDPGQQTAA